MPSVSSKAALLAVATLLEPGSSTSSRRLSGISDLPSFINHVRKMKEVDSSAYELESTTAINCAFDPAFVGAVISNDCLEIAWCDMGHAFVHHSCGEGLIFEETNLTCVPKNDSICHSKYPEAQQAEILQIKPSLPAKVPTTNPITRGLTPPPNSDTDNNANIKPFQDEIIEYFQHSRNSTLFTATYSISVTHALEGGNTADPHTSSQT